MGSQGSIHFYVQDKSVVEMLLAVYANPESKLHKDPTHNGWYAPLIVISDCFISIYDGSFAVCGDMYREATLFSNAVGKPAMCFVNANDDVIEIFAQSGDVCITRGLFADEDWEVEIDIELFRESLMLPYCKDKLENLTVVGDAIALVEGFEAMTGLAFTLRNLDEKCLVKECTFEGVDVYRQAKR